MAILYDSSTSTNGQLTQSGPAAETIPAGGSAALALPRAVPSGSALCVIIGGNTVTYSPTTTLTDNASGNTYTLGPTNGFFQAPANQFGLVSFLA